jgi:hypothetical protein
VNRTPWIFVLLRLLFLTGIAFVTYAVKDGVLLLPAVLRVVGVFLLRKPNFWILLAAVCIAALEVIERFFGTLHFRKEKVQGILDHVVRELFSSKPKENRCSLLKAAKGYVVAPIILYRVLFHSEDKLVHVRAILLNPFGTYLYVWARAKGSRNSKSCVAFRVHNRAGKYCEGIAGKVWQLDVFEAHNLPSLSSDDFPAALNINDLPENSPAARYARAGNIASLHQLRARERYATHFYGAVIESPKTAAKWGVVLVDSIDRDCPWPTSNRGQGKTKLKDFEKQFESFTLILSTVLT